MKENCIDDHLLIRYRQLLDDEDLAFSEMEHDFEEGNGQRFKHHRDAWIKAAEARLAYLGECGVLAAVPSA